MRNVYTTALVQYGPIIVKAGARPKRIGDEWLTVGNIRLSCPWLVFVSCMSIDTPEMLKEVVPGLLKNGVSFRVIRDQRAHYSLNAGLLEGENFAKVLTLYPDNIPHAKTLVAALIGITNRYRGPEIDDGIRLGKTLYVGYAKMLDKCFGPVRLSIPDEKKIPFALCSDYPLKLKLGKCIGDKLYPYGVIASNVKATLYKVVDKKTNTDKLVKRGRRYVADDTRGRHTMHRLQWEKEVLRRLSHCVRVPQNISYFEINGDPCISMDYIDGSSFQEIVDRSFRRRLWVFVYGKKKWAEISAKNRLYLFDSYLAILSIVERLHEIGYVHRDITAANFLLPHKNDVDQRICVIDAELMYSVKDRSPWPPFPRGTPGYIAPEQLNYGSLPITQSDNYSLAALLLFLVTGILPEQFEKEAGEDIRAMLKAVGLGRLVIDCILKGLSASPPLRPTIDQFREAIETEKLHLTQSTKL